MHDPVNEMTHQGLHNEQHHVSTRLKCTPKDFTPRKWIEAGTSKAGLSDTLEHSGLLIIT